MAGDGRETGVRFGCKGGGGRGVWVGRARGGCVEGGRAMSGAGEE
jgi:hypothetical protein